MTDGTSQTPDSPGAMPEIDRRMLEALVCPVTHATAALRRRAGQELISTHARLAFPIRDGIPIMLVEEARQID
jgi:uncharacterized protein YbaR (Trm112 family)